MKIKILIILIFSLIILSNLSWGNTTIWVPSEEDTYHFNQIILAGEDFNLYLKQNFYHSDPSDAYSWGGYSNGNWNINTDCSGGEDANLFRAPPEAGCTLKEYTATNNYLFQAGKPEESTHETIMTLNCAPGNYTIPTKYSLKYLTRDYCSNYNLSEPTFTFRVLPAINMPPFYDYNLFWSKSGTTKRQYIHAQDINEQSDGNYFIKSFEVKVADECTIIDGGAKDKTKQNEIGSLQITTYSNQHSKFTVPYGITTSFQDGLNSYNDTDDTGYIGIRNGVNDNGSSTTTTYANMHYSFPIHAGLIFKNIFGEQANQIKLNSDIISAFLVLDINNATDGYGDFNLALYPVTDPNGNGLPDFDHTALDKWNNRKTSVPWNTPGGDYSTANSAFQFIPQGSDGTKFTFNVTQAVQQWTDLNNNQGWIMKLVSKVPDINYGYNLRINTSENAIINDRPKLIITWWNPSIPLNPDLNNLNLYVDVQCSQRGFRDFNVSITDFDDNSIDLNTSILDLNAYRTDAGDFNANNGPPGVNLEGSPYFAGSFGIVKVNAYGVIDYETDTNHFIVDGTPNWKICTPSEGISCFLPDGGDKNCYFVDSIQGNDTNTIYTEDYNSILGGETAGGVIQKIHEEKFVICSTPGPRKIIYYLSSSADSKTYLDIADIYFLDIKSELKNPYYAIADYNTQINGLGIDNDSIVNIQESVWYAYDEDCGPKGSINTWELDNQTTVFLPPDSNGSDTNTTGTINCTTTGKKAINLVVIADKEFYSGSGLNIYIRGDTFVNVIIPDSLRMESFEIAPSKVKKGNTTEFIVVVKSKVEGMDLNIEVVFDVFDETGVFIESITVPGMALAQGQTQIKTTYNTSALNEKTSYRVTAKAFLLSGSGPIQDKQPINDLEERYFWVLEENNKLETLPETNYLSIIILLISVTLILTKKD